MQRLSYCISVNFYCRTSKIGKDNLAPVEMGVNVNGQRFFCNLPHRYEPKSFAKLFNGRQPNELREYLNALEVTMKSYEYKLVKEGKQVCAAAFKEFVRNGFTSPTENIGYLLDQFHSHIDEKGISKDVVRKYELVTELFLEKAHLTREDFLESITKGKVRDFAEWVNRNYKASTAAGMLTKLKGVFIYAEENRLIDKNPFAGYKIKKVETDVQTITEEEYKRIKALDLSGCQRLERVRDLFCFSCGTGLAYCDTQKLLPSDFKRNDQGQYYIQKGRAKTNVEYTVVVLPDALAIAQKYDFKLPKISNQKLNSYLKAIQDLVGAETTLTMHRSRHYYCRELLNKYKFSYEVAAKCMGHNSTKQTRHYGKVFASTVFDAFAEIEKGGN